ncbi:5395_t:CDS:2, partial [Acaulospora morrowiae]
LQVFYEKVTMTMQSEDDSMMRVHVLKSLEHDTGLAQLLPYFVQFICEKAHSMLKMTDSLINNTSLYLEPHLHHLMPAILTCVVRRKIGVDPDNSHWEIRELAAHILAKICDRYGASYNTLQPRITRVLLSAFTDSSKSLSTHYGCIVAMGALGREVIRSILVPNLKTYAEILSLNNVSDVKAMRCYNAIVDILPKLKETIDPTTVNVQVHDEDLRKRLVDKIGEYFADGVMNKIGDEQVIMAIINFMKTIPSITLLVVLLFVSILNKVEATTPTTLLCLVNKERIRARVRPLALDVRLIKSAQLHTNYMARAGNLTHDDKDGSLGKRIDNVGFDWRAAGENIAYGFYSEDEVGVMKAWVSFVPVAL